MCGSLFNQEEMKRNEKFKRNESKSNEMTKIKSKSK